jgi:hypothetical protein
MPQLDIYMFGSLLYPVIGLFIFLLVVSQLILLSLGFQRILLQNVLQDFNSAKPTFVEAYRFSLLRGLYFREALIYQALCLLLE